MVKGPVIAIDGPAGAGKSTVAKAVAESLGFLYLDTGAMYRAITWAVLRSGIPPDQDEAIADLLDRIDFQVIRENRGWSIHVDGVPVQEELRTYLISQAVPIVAGHRCVREFLVKLQRELAEQGNIILDGRDIGTYVLPEADCKIFLVASEEERVRRRWQQINCNGKTVPYVHVEKELAERDRHDRERAHAPLRQAEDAVVIDTTGRTIDSIVDEIISLCGTRMQ